MNPIKLNYTFPIPKIDLTYRQAQGQGHSSVRKITNRTDVTAGL